MYVYILRSLTLLSLELKRYTKQLTKVITLAVVASAL